MKALGTGLGGFALDRGRGTRGSGGDGADRRAAVARPARRGRRARPTSRQAGRFHLSLTHTTEVAVAFVVAERSVPCSPS